MPSLCPADSLHKPPTNLGTAHVGYSSWSTQLRTLAGPITIVVKPFCYPTPSNLKMSTEASATEFPYTLTLTIPLLTERLANSALETLEVDPELSPLVRREFALLPAKPSEPQAEKSTLQVTYRATTNRMLRVSVNGFMESLGVILEVMGQLDTDVLEHNLDKDEE
ncbi:transcription factor Pcc1-domain-containing protein [Aspergillus ambiguus]|uniref:CTAG/PCC1 family protein n=1 Tax=Aspergillus ambiguus TaxID=176160 RepID=UPI003CCCA3E3